MNILSEHLQGHFTLVTIRPGKHTFPAFGVVDFTNISLDKAESLFSNGFPFLRKVNSNEKSTIQKITECSIPIPIEIERPLDPSQRLNKKLINKLLALNWSDLSQSEKFLFFYSEQYFLGKKQLMLENGDLKQQMVSLHAKVRSMINDKYTDSDRSLIMKEIFFMEDSIAENWKIIDTWQEQEVEFFNQESTALEKNSVKIALDLKRQIEVDKLWISRANATLPKMKTESSLQKKLKTDKTKELILRKERLEKNQNNLNLMTQ